MKVILFCAAGQPLGRVMETRIHLELPEMETRQVDSMEILAQTLCRPLNQVAVILMVDPEKRDVLKLLDSKDMISGIHLIFMMDPVQRSTLSPLALQLKTSFIGTTDGIDDVLSVLKKVLVRICLRNRIFPDPKIGI